MIWILVYWAEAMRHDRSRYDSENCTAMILSHIGNSQHSRLSDNTRLTYGLELNNSVAKLKVGSQFVSGLVQPPIYVVIDHLHASREVNPV